jgi:hypothetical protein
MATRRYGLGCWTAILLLCTYTYGELKVDSLEMGLLMREVDMRIRMKEWMVVVVMEEDSLDFEPVETAMALLDRKVTKSMYQRNFLIRMEHQLARLKGRTSELKYHNRQKRGLVDGVGLIAHGLF